MRTVSPQLWSAALNGGRQKPVAACQPLLRVALGTRPSRVRTDKPINLPASVCQTDILVHYNRLSEPPTSVFAFLLTP